MIRRLTGALLVAGLTGLAAAHPGHLGTALHAHSIADARPLAQREAKLIFVHVRSTDAPGWTPLRVPTEQTGDLRDLLFRETVIVELRGGEELGLADADLPAILLLEPDGTERMRRSAAMPLRSIERGLQSALNCDAVIRAQRALDTLGQRHFFTRERRAAAFLRNGRRSEARAELDWCLRQVLAADVDLSAIGRRAAVLRLAAHAATFDEATAELVIEHRAAAERLLLDGHDDPALARDLAHLNRLLGDPAASVALFDLLPDGSRARRGLFDVVFDDLARAGRYEEIRSLIDPAEALDGELAWYRRTTVTRPAWAAHGTGRGTRTFVLRRAAGLIETLRAAGDQPAATQLRTATLAAVPDAEAELERLLATEAATSEGGAR